MKKLTGIIMILLTIAFMYWAAVLSPWAFFSEEVKNILEPPIEENKSIETYDEEETEKWLEENFTIDEDGFVRPKGWEWLR